MLRILERSKFLVLMAIAAIAITACGDNSTEANDCAVSADCPEGQRCGSAGVCTTQEQTCSVTADCAPDEFCQPTDLTCELNACADDEACGQGAICSNERCRPGCRSDEDCGEGSVCSSTNVCEVEGCVTGSCGDFQFCNDQLDPPACEFNGDCDCGTPPEGVSDAEWCETQPGGNPVCGFWARQEGEQIEFICSNAANECVERPECTDDSSRRQNEICEPEGFMGRRICRTGCRDTDECPPFNICVEAQGKVCLPGCSDDVDCDANQTCVDAVCVDTCVNRQDCDVVGQVCSGNPPTCRGCSNSNQCAAVEFCDFTLGSSDEEREDPLVGLCAPIVTCPDDGYGDNDSIDEAYGVMSPFDGTGMNAPAFCAENLGGDWYEVNTNNGDVVTVTLNYDEQKGNLDIALLQDNGQQLVASARPPQDDNGTEQLSYGVPLGQPLAIQVRGSIVQDFINYDITIDVSPAAACTDDGYEPNNDLMNAIALPLDATTGIGDYDDLQVCGDDRDFFELCADANQVVQVDVEADPRFGNVDFTIRDSSGSILANANSAERLERIEVLTEDPDCLTVELFPASGVGVIDYDFRWTQRPNVCTDQFEQNDTCPQQVTNLAEGDYTDLAICSDADYYCFDVLPLQTIDFKACYDANVAGDLDVTLFGPDDCAAFLQTETRASGTAPNEVCETLNYQVNDAGQYCVQGSLFSGLNVPYRVEFDLIDGPACNNDANANNTAATAVTFDTAQARTGDDNVGGGRICDLEDDWYSVDIADGDVLEFDVRFIHANGNIDAFLYGPNDSTTLLDSGETTTDGEVVTYTAGTGEGGTYYLRVTGTPAARNDYTVILNLNGVGPPDPDCPDDFENNDSRAEAATVMGQSYLGLTACGVLGDVDWYTIDLLAGESITIDINYQPSNGNADIYFFDDRATTVATTASTLNTGTDTVSYRSARDQTVAWRVQTNSSSPVTPYSMNVNITPAPACADDGFEDNDTVATATALNLESIYGGLNKCEGDEDWYSIVVPNGSTAEVFANFEHGQANLDLELYDATGTTLLQSANTTTNDESLNIAAPTADTTYLVKVITTENARIRYDLLTYKDGAGPQDRVCPDLFEQNDSFAAAAQLPIGLTEDLLICWQGGTLNDRDWYAITVPSGATVTVDLLFNHGLGDIDATLYRGNTGSPVGNSLTTTDNEQIVDTNPNSSPTTYLLQVFGKGTARFSNYYEVDIQLSYPDDCSLIDDTVTSASRADAETAGETAPEAYSALQLCENTEDWVKLPAGTTSVEAHVEYEASLGNIDLELVEWDGTTEAIIATSAGSTNFEDINETGLDAGRTYYLRIFATGFTRTEYDLWFATNAGTPTIGYCPDSYERNDTLNLAASLPNTPVVKQIIDAVACGLDDDYYSLSPVRTVPNTFAVFSNSPGDQDIVLETVDPTGNVVATEDSLAEGDEILDYSANQAGDYRILVRNKGNDAAPYDLLYGPTTMYSTACPEDSYESNDNFALALALPIPFDGALGRCFNDDWFSVTPTSADPITVEARYDGSRLNLAFQIQGMNVFETGTGSGNRTTATFTPVAGQTYLIGIVGARVNMSDPGPRDGPYFLHITQ